MCSWLALGIHNAIVAKIGTSWLCDGSQLWDGAEELGIDHLYVPLDPYHEGHVAGAIAPDAAGQGLADADSHSVDARITADLSWRPEPCGNFLGSDAVATFATSRTQALRRISDAQLGRQPARRARQFCSNFQPRRTTVASRAPEPSFVLTALDTATHQLGATRRCRFRF